MAVVGRYHTRVSGLVFVVVVMQFLQAQEGALRSSIEEARQVECVHPAGDLISLTLQEVGNTSRQVEARQRHHKCSAGHDIFHACSFDGGVVKITAILPALQDGEVRVFNCTAWLERSPDPLKKILGQVSVSKGGPTSHTSRTDLPPGRKLNASVESYDSAEHKQCVGSSSTWVIILGVLVVIFGVFIVILLVVYCRARRDVTSVTACSPGIRGVRGVKVGSSNEYQASVHSAPAGQDVAGRGLVMQNQQPVVLLSAGTLAPPTDAGGVDSGLQLYQQPWGQLDGEIAGRLASIRPTPRMCHVPGFKKPGIVTDRPSKDKE